MIKIHLLCDGFFVCRRTADYLTADRFKQDTAGEGVSLWNYRMREIVIF